MSKALSFKVIAAIVAAIAISLGAATYAFASFTAQERIDRTVGYSQNYNFFVATTTNATSTNTTDPNDIGWLNIAGAQSVEFLAKRGDTKGTGNAGQTQIKFQVAVDKGLNWFDVPVAISTSTSQGLQASVLLSGTSSALVALDLRMGGYYAARCLNIELTDGEATCSAFIVK